MKRGARMEERNLDLLPRNEETRDKNPPVIVKFDLDEINQHFEENIQYIRTQFGIAEQLINDNKREEAQNIWNSQIVFLESAFDFYLHELTKYALSEMFMGNWSKTIKYNNLLVKMSIVDKALNAREDSQWFIDFVNEFYERITLVSYESVKDQMNLLGLDLQEIADEAFYEQGSSVRTKDKLKCRLSGLFLKRNIIAHQSGRRHADAQREEITEEIVKDYIQDVLKIVAAMQKQAKTKG